jgi:hypothetical protein
MSERTQLDARLLTAAELEVVNATRPPAIEQASDEQLKVLAQRLRQPQRPKCWGRPMSALRRN